MRLDGVREFWSRLRASVGGRRGIADELAEELRAHVEMEAEDRVAGGAPPEEARAAALRRVGNRAAIAERAGETWGFPSFESFGKDLRHGFRGIRRSPGFSLVVILTLALGIGLTTAIFSVVRETLLKPLPYPGGERLVRLAESTGKAQGISITWVNFRNWRDSSRSFEAMAGFQFTERTLTGRGDATVTRGLVVTAPYFALLGMRPLLGRFFDETDDRPGAAPVIVLNHRFWSGQLGGDPKIVGAMLTLNGNVFEVAGVAAPLWEPWKVDYYLPLARALGNTTDRTQHNSMRALARLRPGITLAAARGELDAILRHLAEIDPGPENEHRSYAMYWAESNSKDVRGTLLILMGAAGLILLIACANVASLLVARNVARGGEIALRLAIGAGRLRLARQLLTESVVIAAVGGAAGVGLAHAALRLLIALAPGEIPRLSEAAIDVPVLLFACAITLAAGLAAGVAPVLLAGKVDLAGSLKEGWRLAGGGGRRQAFRNVLVCAEVALTFVLAFGAGLLVRSLIAAQNVSRGFDADRLLSFDLQLPDRAYRTPEAAAEFYARLLAGLRATRGVAAATAVYGPPGGGDRGDWFYSIPGGPVPAKTDVPIALFNIADAGYFRAMGIPIRHGRDFSQFDGAASSKVAVVNETLARRWWPDPSAAIGRQIKVSGPYQEGPLLEIVGVAGDVKQDGLDSAPMPEIYQPFGQKRSSAMAILVRCSGDPAQLVPSIRAQVRALDRNLPVARLETVEASLGASLARRRFSTLLLSIFAALAMALAAIGIYGLLSYWVSVRESEIAVRLALGAPPATILRWTSFHALRLAAVGIAFGALGAWAAARGLESLVFGIPPRNPVTIAGAAIAVAGIAVAASALPAWRAARIDAARHLHS